MSRKSSYTLIEEELSPTKYELGLIRNPLFQGMSLSHIRLLNSYLSVIKVSLEKDIKPMWVKFSNRIKRTVERKARRGIILENTLTLEDFIDLVIDCENKCSVTRKPLEWNKPGTWERQNYKQASIDRKIPSNGYTKKNCRVISWWGNRAKGADPMGTTTRVINNSVK